LPRLASARSCARRKRQCAHEHARQALGEHTWASLEPEFWDALKEIAERGGKSLAGLIAEVDAARGAVPASNLSSALRVFVLNTVRNS
jgi:predicted DNA-binding ribbon-helix-helix protein